MTKLSYTEPNLLSIIYKIILRLKVILYIWKYAIRKMLIVEESAKHIKNQNIGNFIITYFDIPYFKDQVQGKSSLVEIGIKIGTVFHKMNIKIQASTVHITFT